MTKKTVALAIAGLTAIAFAGCSQSDTPKPASTTEVNQFKSTDVDPTKAPPGLLKKLPDGNYSYQGHEFAATKK